MGAVSGWRQRRSGDYAVYGVRPAMVSDWIVFYLAGKEILRISKAGLHEGEIEATLGLLAYERGVCESDIEFAEVGR